MVPWNSEGQINRHVAEAKGWSSRSADRVMADLFAEFIDDFYRLGDYANEPGVPECNWNWQSSATVETYIYFLMGIPRPEE
jgi:hypothetical protein